MALFYPLSVATISAGLIAFLMILLKMDPLLTSAVTLWFYLISAVSIYLITKEALVTFGVQKIYLGLILTVGFLALASLLLLLRFGR